MVSDLKTFTNKGCKIAAQKKELFLAKFCLTQQDFLVLVLLSISVERFFVSLMQDFWLFTTYAKKKLFDYGPYIIQALLNARHIPKVSEYLTEQKRTNMFAMVCHCSRAVLK